MPRVKKFPRFGNYGCCVVDWYDNEWGYSNKVLEMARVMSR